MRIPTRKDFEALNEWGIIENPLAAIEDYTEEQKDLRWENERNRRAHEEYLGRRGDWGGEGFQEHYKSMSRPIDRVKWEYLKKRKSWYICPLQWGQFAKPSIVRILDLGCGDGDVTQRVADYVAGRWRQMAYDGFPLEIVGVDLNESRIRNAKKLCSSPHPKVTLSFETGDSASGKLDFDDGYFDYALMTGVLEIMEDPVAHRTLDEVCRVVSRGLYIQDMLDEYPGGYPRPELPSILEEKGLEVKDRHKVLSEPFVEEGTRDPLDIWPALIQQIVFAEYPNPETPTDRYEDR